MKFGVFLKRVAQKRFNISGSNLLGQLIVLCLLNIQNCFCSFIRNCIAYAHEVNFENKDCPIVPHRMDAPRLVIVNRGKWL